MLSTYGHEPGPPQMGPGPPHATRNPADGSPSRFPQMGPGPPRAYPDPRELSARLAAREGPGTATFHADAGTSLPLEAPSPTRIKCEWLRRALLPLGKATPRRKGQTVLLLTRPPYEGIKCQPLLHSARVRRRQAATPHSGSDRSPVRQLRSLLPGAVAALWEPATQCKTCSALLQLLCCQLPMPHSCFPFHGAPKQHGHDSQKRLRP